MTKFTFSELVANNFDEIVRNFKVGLKKNGYRYDEDVMNDAFINCYNSLKDKELTKQEMLKYFWTSYINRLKNVMLRENHIEYCDDMSLYEDIEETAYNNTPDRIYNIILQELQDHFGIRKTTMWELYTCKGKTTNEIKAMGFKNVPNMACLSKVFKRYINNHIIPNNQELQELIKFRKGG